MDCFIHIPKCGGTSMIEILSQVYGNYVKDPAPGKFWWIHGLNAAEQYLRSTHLGQPACIAGHISYGFTRFLPDEAKVFTLIRHPVDRVISLFHHKLGLTGGGKTRWYKMGFTDETTIEEWVMSGIDPGLDNAMTAQLSGMPIDSEMQPLYAIHSYHFEQAIDNLKGVVVGTLEDTDKALDKFSSELKWEVQPVFPHENSRKHPGKESISVDVLNEIISRNKFDLMLYDTVVNDEV